MERKKSRLPHEPEMSAKASRGKKKSVAEKPYYGDETSGARHRKGLRHGGRTAEKKAAPVQKLSPTRKKNWGAACCRVEIQKTTDARDGKSKRLC